MADMKNFLGLGLLGAAAYLLYEYFYAAPATSSVSSSGSASGTNVSTTPPTRVLGTTLRSQILTATGASATTTMNADQWSYYYNGINSTAPISAADFDALFVAPFGGDRSKLYTLDAYLQTLSSRGLAGIHGYDGGCLGRIGTPTTVAQDGATAFELAVKRM